MNKAFASQRREEINDSRHDTPRSAAPKYHNLWYEVSFRDLSPSMLNSQGC